MVGVAQGRCPADSNETAVTRFARDKAALGAEARVPGIAQGGCPADSDETVVLASLGDDAGWVCCWLR